MEEARTSSPPAPPAEQLQPNSIGLPGVLFQSITTMAPASAVAFSLGPAVGATGITLPLAVLIALVVCAFIALCIGSMAKYLPSAGGFFTYISNALGVQLGWVTGWLFNLAYLLIVPFQLLVLGPVMDSLATQYLGLSFGEYGWAIWASVFTVIIFVLTYFGIKVSADAGVILGFIEIAIFAAFSIWLIITAGNANTVEVFNPANSKLPGFGGLEGVVTGMLFVLLAFAGFESSAPLAEETLNPRRTVPRAIFLAAIIVGLFYLLCSYAAMVSWSPAAQIDTYTKSPDPWREMAGRFSPLVQLAIILAILNSALANANAGVNASTRVLYAMGRTRTLPGIFAHLNRFRTPDIAIFLSMIVALAASLGLGFAYEPTMAFAFLGTILILPIILVYLLTCIAVPVFYLRQHREEFNILRHIIVPLIPLVVLLYVLYLQFAPLPAPLSFALPIVGGWLLLGIVIVVLLSIMAPALLQRSSKVYIEGDEYNGR